jgi:hypothetical protein
MSDIRQTIVANKEGQISVKEVKQMLSEARRVRMRRSEMSLLENGDKTSINPIFRNTIALVEVKKIDRS